MRKKKGYSAEKSRRYRERKADQGKKLLRAWVTHEEIELVRWFLVPENFARLRRIMEQVGRGVKNGV